MPSWFPRLGPRYDIAGGLGVNNEVDDDAAERNYKGDDDDNDDDNGTRKPVSNRCSCAVSYPWCSLCPVVEK